MATRSYNIALVGKQTLSDFIAVFHLIPSIGSIWPFQWQLMHVTSSRLKQASPLRLFILRYYKIFRKTRQTFSHKGPGSKPASKRGSALLQQHREMLRRSMCIITVLGLETRMESMLIGDSCTYYHRANNSTTFICQCVKHVTASNIFTCGVVIHFNKSPELLLLYLISE